MKTTNWISWVVLVAAGAVTGANAETFRTDINPALRYYQAFVTAPDLSKADRDYLFTNEWWGQKLPDRFGELVSQYNSEFKLVRQAGHAAVPCDWGLDFSPGPDTLLAHLARAKVVAQAARLRTMWDLQHGRETEARDDLIGALVLGRNLSRDGCLISTLVQIAMENIVCATIAENYNRFSPESLKQLADGLDAAPARGTVAAAIQSERLLFCTWFEHRVLELRQENPGSDASVMAGLRPYFDYVNWDGGGSDTNLWPRIVAASGGASDGMLRLIRELPPLYSRLTTIMTLPLPDYETQIKTFMAEIQASTNPLVTLSLPALVPSRTKEFETLARQAMVRAAVQYRLHGEAALKSVMDPCGTGPFAFQRFVFEGVDRGFELKSAYAGRSYPTALIFVQKDGPPFYVQGPNIGKAIPSAPRDGEGRGTYWR